MSHMLLKNRKGIAEGANLSLIEFIFLIAALVAAAVLIWLASSSGNSLADSVKELFEGAAP